MILDSVKLDYDDLLIVPQRSSLDSRANVDLLREYHFPHCKQILKCTGVIASNMYNVGTTRMTYALAENNLLTALHKFNHPNDLIKLLTDPLVDERFFITIGESGEELEKLQSMCDFCDWEETEHNRLMVCIDVANAYRDSFVDFIRRFRDVLPGTLLMAGNVTTPDMTADLIKAGVDIVKIGIGPGSACLTRSIAGVGYPMASACLECADAAHGLKGLICADGGCRTVGDICKAFCLQADFVMIGGMLAGTDECDGEWREVIDYDKYTYSLEKFNNYINTSSAYQSIPKIITKKQLKFFGMSSKEAMEKFGGAAKDYRASEGSSTYIDYKGPASGVAKEILGGLRSCCTYLGAGTLKELPRRATLVRINK